METEKESKSSIFTCKSCKSAEIKVERKPKPDGPKSIVAKLEPAKSSNMDKKYIVKLDGKTVSFGEKGMSDFTINKDEGRR
jgi:hypothetical protein